jgi:hypothetical protein
MWQIAQSVSPETVAAARVKIAAATWQAAKLAPKRYVAKVEDGENGRPQANVYIQKFEEEKDQAVLIDRSREPGEGAFRCAPPHPPLPRERRRAG